MRLRQKTMLAIFVIGLLASQWYLTADAAEVRWWRHIWSNTSEAKDSLLKIRNFRGSNTQRYHSIIDSLASDKKTPPSDQPDNKITKESPFKARENTVSKTTNRASSTSQSTNLIAATNKLKTNKNYRNKVDSIPQGILNIRPLQQKTAVTDFAEERVPIFALGINYPRVNSRSFQEAILLSELSLAITDRVGAVVHNPEYFALVINDQELKFAPNGTIQTNILGARIAAGGSLDLEIGLKIRSDISIPQLPSQLRVRLLSAKIIGEHSQKSIKTVWRGNRTSNFVSFDPTVTSSDDVSIQSSSSLIFGRNLLAGEKATVMSFRLEATGEDLLFTHLNIRNDDKLIGNYIERVNLIHQNTKKTISSAIFINGLAGLNIPYGVYIGRGTMQKFAVQVIIKEKLPTASFATLQFDIADNDISVQGIASGENIEDIAKYINASSEEFIISWAGGRIIPNKEQPSLVVARTPATLYYFSLYNDSRRYMSLGRISFQFLFSEGVNFTDGMSADDFELAVLSGAREHVGDFTATNINTALQTVSLDALKDFNIPPNSKVDFALRVSLEGSSHKESVGVKILGDRSSTISTIDALRASGMNFIWSDNSANPHSLRSSDWLSGGIFGGLPTNNIVIK